MSNIYPSVLIDYRWGLETPRGVWMGVVNEYDLLPGVTNGRHLGCRSGPFGSRKPSPKKRDKLARVLHQAGVAKW